MTAKVTAYRPMAKPATSQYENRLYFVVLEENAEVGRLVLRLHRLGRWEKNGDRYPLWLNSPERSGEEDDPMSLLEA